MAFQRTQLPQCPACKTYSLVTIESRKTEHGTRRRKECEHCKHRLTTHEVSADFYQQAKDNLILVAQLHKLLGSQLSDVEQMDFKCVCVDCKYNLNDQACSFDLPEHGTIEAYDCIHYVNQASV